jgi:hypothetical protein
MNRATESKRAEKCEGMHRASTSSSSSSRHRSSIRAHPDGEGHLVGSLDAATVEGATVDGAQHLHQVLHEVTPFFYCATDTIWEERTLSGIGHLMCLEEGCSRFNPLTLRPLVSSCPRLYIRLQTSRLDSAPCHNHYALIVSY